MQLPKGIESKFQYVMLVAKRAEQIIEGSMPRTRTRHSKPARIARHEIDEGLVEYRVGEDVVMEEEAEVEA
ncbi:MAG: DNA-directed RNA polymerase subunit omega [Thermoanaerobaculia bacterium]|nr:DNA-directed RNA polymerase subunit omega [Thermoanaerobaculia bacterium]